MKILVTGANGFVGQALCSKFLADGHSVSRAVRTYSTEGGLGYCAIGDIGPFTDWSQALRGCDAVVHAAARVHVMRDQAVDLLTEFRTVNTAGTLALAKQAAVAGVRRFIFISTIKVNGESSPPDKPFQASDAPHPHDAYAISKLEAEQGLLKLAQETGMEVVCIRPPLVYGPGVKANFRALIRLLGYGVPVPLASIRNKRSLVGIDNLVDLITVCLSHPAAAGQIFLASDGHDLSTPELLRGLAQVLQQPARLFPFPPALLCGVAAVLGHGTSARRLCVSLSADIKHTHDTLQWTPPVSVAEGLRRTVTPPLNKLPLFSSTIMKRIFDLLVALCLCIVLLPVLISIALLIRLSSRGSALYWSNRVGRDNIIFKMPKFRSMRIDTPSVATHLLQEPERWLTPIGSFLRKSSLDELPQLWSILKGDMTFVGPRPALFNQDDLISLRTEAGVHRLTPGLTGWAQVNGRDELPIPDKVRLDAQYLKEQCLCLDLRILWMTFLKVIRRDGVAH